MSHRRSSNKDIGKRSQASSSAAPSRKAFSLWRPRHRIRWSANARRTAMLMLVLQLAGAAAFLPLLWLALMVSRSALAMCAPHIRAVPRPAHSSSALPRALQPLLGVGNWGLIAAARGLSARASADALHVARGTCGGVFLTRAAFGQPVVMVMDLEAVGRIMFATPYRYTKMDISKRLMAPLLGWEGLLLAEGEQHRRLRAKVGKCMHHEAVAAFSSVFLEEASRLRDFLSEGGDGGDRTRVLRLREGVDAATCRTVVRSFFPKAVLSDARIARIQDLYTVVLADAWRLLRDFVVNAVLWFLPASMITRGARDKRAIRDMAREMLGEAAALHDDISPSDQRKRAFTRSIEVTRASSSTSASSPMASRDGWGMVDFLLQEKAGVRLTGQEQLDNLQNFLGAGQLTTQVSISYTLWRLAKHPVWQARVAAELQACAPVWRDPSRPAAERVEALCALPVLTRVLKESLRLYPPIAMAMRVVIESDELCGFCLEPGTLVAIPIQAIHYDPLVWDDPMTFDPDRFLPEREAVRDKMAWLPFLYGPRGCIGQRFALREMAVLCAEVINSFELSVDPDANEVPLMYQDIYPFPDAEVHGSNRDR